MSTGEQQQQQQLAAAAVVVDGVVIVSEAKARAMRAVTATE